MSPTLTRTLGAAALLALLSSCGQRGPLTLPDKNKHTATPAAGTAPATAAPAGAAVPAKKQQDDAKL